MYEGKPIGMPGCGAGAFWRLIEQHRVKSFFCAPTALRAIRREDPNGAEMAKYDLSSLDSVFLAGERCDPNTMQWAQTLLDVHKFKVDISDNWWQTETGWPITGSFRGDAMTQKLEATLGSGGYAVW